MSDHDPSKDDIIKMANELSIVASKCPVGSLTRTTLEAGIQAAKTPGMHPLALVLSMVVGMTRALDQLFLNLAALEEQKQMEEEACKKQQEAEEVGGVTQQEPVEASNS